MFLYEYFTIVIILTAFADPVRSNNSSENDTCVQKTEEGHCCQLPFSYNGKTYYSCTKDGSGFLWQWFWCYYQDNTKYDKCKEPIYQPPGSTQSTKTTPTKQQISQSSSSLNVVRMTTYDLVMTTSESPHSSRIGKSSPSSSTTAVLAQSETRTRSSSTTKQNIYIILACGISGGVLLAVIIALTVVFYLKRKRKIKVTKKEEECEQEMRSYRLTDESNNPVYESIDKDLDIQSNDEQQALRQPAHVYHELEDPESPTSCNHEYNTPYDTSIPNSGGANTSPASNESDGFTHLNELYEAS